MFNELKKTDWKIYMAIIFSKTKAPVTPNGDPTVFVQRSENLSARCGVAAKYT